MSADEPLRILHIVAPARSGGIESVIRELSVGHRALGHDVSVAAILDPGTEVDHPFLEGLRQAGVPMQALSVGGRAYLAERRDVGGLITRGRPHIVHTHGFRPDIVDAPVARAQGAATVTTLHGFIGSTARGRLYEWLQVRAARYAHRVIAVSEPVAARVRQAGSGHRLDVIPNAVSKPSDALVRSDARRQLGLPPDAFVVGWIGRISSEKGADIFLRAVAHSGTAAHAVIVGDGPDRTACESLAGELGLGARVHFAGLRPGASRYLAAFDALALTSRTEGTPMVLLEAMWASLPIVATSVGGVPAVLRESDALLCPSQDVHAIGDAITRLNTDASLRTALAASARLRVEQEYSPERWLTAHLAAYRLAQQVVHR